MVKDLNTNYLICSFEQYGGYNMASPRLRRARKLAALAKRKQVAPQPEAQEAPAPAVKPAIKPAAKKVAVKAAPKEKKPSAKKAD